MASLPLKTFSSSSPDWDSWFNTDRKTQEDYDDSDECLEDDYSEQDHE
jgi:hypothetical protein